MMGLFKNLLGHSRDRATLAPAYARMVAIARAPEWYRDGAVPDTVTGRFDMVATILALLLIRLEREPDRRSESALLAELFIEDMDGQLRNFGVGDVVVGKQIGHMLGTLGARIGSLKPALEPGGDMDGFVARNIHRGEASAVAVAFVGERLRAAAAQFDRESSATLLTAHP